MVKLQKCQIAVLLILEIAACTCALGVPGTDCQTVICPPAKCSHPFTPPGECCAICPEPPTPDCSAVLCLRPDCNDPFTPPGECCAICPEPPTPDCSAVLCLKPDCDDPFTPPGECCAICPEPPTPDCSAVLCLRPDCDDPFTPPGECCAICPEPPTPDCRLVRCAKPPCLNPVVTPPGECCPVCPKPDCSLVLCAQPLCANPVTPPGECCPSCENSGCKFEGCVQFFSNGGVQWKPNPCTFCSCFDNQTICAVASCFLPTEEDCFGYPVVTKPGDCCPSCDFGIPDRKCGVVPSAKKNITVSSGFQKCSETVIEHKCDKLGFRKRNKKFRCQPKEIKKAVDFDDDKCPLCAGLYTDVVKCKAVPDNDINVGCDLVVDAKKH